MSNFYTLSIPANTSIIGRLDRLILESRGFPKTYTTLVRLKESIINLFIKEYYLSIFYPILL